MSIPCNRCKSRVHATALSHNDLHHFMSGRVQGRTFGCKLGCKRVQPLQKHQFLHQNAPGFADRSGRIDRRDAACARARSATVFATSIRQRWRRDSGYWKVAARDRCWCFLLATRHTMSGDSFKVSGSSPGRDLDVIRPISGFGMLGHSGSVRPSTRLRWST